MSRAKGLQISPDLRLPLSAVTATGVVLGGKGMGKTNLGGVIVEEMSYAGLRWSVIDPMGVWWGIRHSEDGKGKGVECLILGGAKGDIPIEPTGGAVVADLVADEQVNVVIDISRKPSGEMWSIGERIRFMRDYGQQLYKRQGSLVDGRRREPICQIIDEAARFIPQTIRSNEDDVAKCSAVWSAIVEEGRNVGIGVFMLTQRNARLNKDVAELADVMFAFRTIGPKSLDAVMDWLGAHVPKHEMQQLSSEVRSLPVGSCLTVSPGWLQVEKVVPIRMRNTFDSSATPKPGESARRVRGAGAVPDLAKYTQRMKETIERAKDENVAELKKRIRDLEGKLAKVPAAVPSAPEAKTAPREITEREKAVILRPLLQERKSIGKLLVSAGKDVANAAAALKRVDEVLGNALGFVSSNVPLEDVPPTTPAVQTSERSSVQTLTRPSVLTPTGTEPPVNAEVKLRGKSIEMLRVCARMYPKGLTEAQVASQVGMKRSGGTWGDYKSLLKTSGSLRIEGGLWYATAEGMRRAGQDIPAAPSTTAEVLAMWLPKMRGKAKDMLRLLVESGGEPMSREELGQAVGVSTSGGTFGDYLSLLRTADLIITDGNGVRANAETLLL